MADTRRTSEPLAIALFNQLRDKSEADRRLVYRALVWRLASRHANGQVARDPDRVAWSLEALGACEDKLRKFPSKRNYRDWHSDYGKTAGWPSAGFIVNTFGSWSEAAAAAGGAPTIDPLARRLLANGPSFEEDELVGLLRACASDLRQDWLTYGVYRAWAEQATARRDPRFRRIALARGTFQRCGGWTAAVQKAGLRPYEPGNEFREAAVESRGLSDRDVLGAVRREAKAEKRRLTFSRFDELRTKRERAAAEQGDRLPTIRAKRLVNRFGSWADVLFRAGLITEEERGLRSCEGQFQIDEAGALAMLGTEVGRRRALTPSEHCSWRRQQILAGSDRRHHPSASWLRTRFGDWDSVIQAAIEAGVANDSFKRREAA